MPKNFVCSDKNTLQAVFSLVKAMIEERDLQALLLKIHDQTKQVIQVSRCTIFLYNRSNDNLVSWISPELEIEEIRLKLGQGIAGQVAATKDIMIVNNVLNFLLFDSSWDQKTGYCTKNILAVPMLARGSELVGVIEAINKNEGDFDDHDANLLMTFASLAASAIRDVERDMERERFLESVVSSFGETIDARSAFTSGHSRRVAAYAKNFGLAAGLSRKELTILYYAALLHDVGKIGVKDSILEKPGPLTKEEYQQIKDHVAYTRNILNAIDFPDDLKEIPQIASSHHEQINGQGYPVGLQDDQIPNLAKMLSIVDMYESLTARDRPYRQALTIEKALEILIQNKKTSFDSALVDLFIAKCVYKTELRMHKRVNVDLAIEYILNAEGCIKENDIGRAKALNISQGGILFSSDILFPINKLIDLTVYLPNDRFEVLAKVVRCKEILSCRKYEIGLLFVDLSSANLDKLQKYLHNLY